MTRILARWAGDAIVCAGALLMVLMFASATLPHGPAVAAALKSIVFIGVCTAVIGGPLRWYGRKS